jgi:glycerophosphoryl diester phosphodiesterase
VSRDRRPLICAHRGASATLPDNSLAAFEAAIGSGCEAIETDLRRAPDGRIVLAHDKGDAQREDVVDLDSLLALADGQIGLALELKEPGLERDLLTLIGEQHSVIVSSFLPGVVRALRELAPGLETGLLVEPPADGDLTELAQLAGAGALMVDEALLTDDLLGPAADAGLPVWVWTVNDEARLRALLAEPRLAGLITDQPERAVALREERHRHG